MDGCPESLKLQLWCCQLSSSELGTRRLFSSKIRRVIAEVSLDVWRVNWVTDRPSCRQSFHQSHYERWALHLENTSTTEGNLLCNRAIAVNVADKHSNPWHSQAKTFSSFVKLVWWTFLWFCPIMCVSTYDLWANQGLHAPNAVCVTV